jgi:excisionase family DNA binding protein
MYTSALAVQPSLELANMKQNPETPSVGLKVEKSFCTTREAATLLGVSVGTVQLWVESGLLQAWKTAGGHRRVLRDSVDRLLQKKPASMALVAGPGEATQAESRRLRIVVVDDDEHMLGLYRIQMARWPMAPEVTVFDNAVAALLAIGRSCPDLLVTDLHMPGMDGFNMLRVLSTAPEISKTTIVVASALEATAIEQRGGLPPGVELLPKPVPFDRLLVIATGILKQGRFLRPPGWQAA